MKILYNDGHVAECPEEMELEVLRHSGAHIMAQAVKRLYPQAHFAYGPATEKGFHYDIDLGDVKLTDEDLPAIEKEMQKIVKENLPFKVYPLPREEAIQLMKDRGEIYKVEHIGDLPEDAVITFYQQGDYIDMCVGPHLTYTKALKAFKLTALSGAYWKNDQKNKMLTRLNGVAFRTQDELKEYEKQVEEAKARDHRKIGKDMQLFMTDDLIGKGLPMFLPKGYTLWRELENYIRDKELRLGYQHVMTPCVGTVDLYRTSGHWDHYKANMFPAMEMEGESFVLRPMNCPHHMMIYANRLHSYRDLPIRIGEIAHDFRFEPSGTLKGIERGRHFCQNDAHLFVTPEQIKDEVASVQDDEMWEKAESALREVLRELDIQFTEEIGEAAFYGPKLDVNVKPAIGAEYTLSTCQLDFCLPAKFNLKYIDKDGEEKTPVVLHRAILGSIDRFMAYLIEETKGAFPLWVAPLQVKVLPVSDKSMDYAAKVTEELLDRGIRAELDERNEKIGYKIRYARQEDKVPYMLIIGEKEVNENTLSVRDRATDQTEVMTLDAFAEKIHREVREKK